MANIDKEKQAAVEALGYTEEKEVIKDEVDLLEGLLMAAGFREDEEMRKKVQIKRKGKVAFEFTIAPLSEADFMDARKKATTYRPNPANPKLPRIEWEVNPGMYRSHVIHAATIPEDRAKTWDNKQLIQKLNVLQGVETIDKVLTAGEKNAVCDLIEEISQYEADLDLTEYAKN